MIEVEKKFILTERQRAKLLFGAEFVKEDSYVDSYYDTANFNLSVNDIWLRNRSGQWELKIPMHQNGGELEQQYQEIEGEDAIRQVFGIVPNGIFLDDISQFGYAPFCELSSKRLKYLKDGFIIDLDEVQGEDFKYEIAEIELMVDDKENMESAIKKIQLFAQANDLESMPVRGKVREYLFQKRPAHYKVMIEAGIIKA